MTVLIARSDTIPRPCGDIILGGFKTPNEWESTARPEEAEDILKRAYAVCPELAPPDEPTLEGLRKSLVEVGCGLRPARAGGIRIGHEIRDIGEKPTPIVYHYG